MAAYKSRQSFYTLPFAISGVPQRNWKENIMNRNFKVFIYLVVNMIIAHKRTVIFTFFIVLL